MLIAMCLGVLLVAVVVAYFLPHGLRYEKMWRAKPILTKKRLLALTYDDGPSSDATPALLDLLAAYNAKATFFPLGCNGAAHPELLDRMIREGHLVGCHGNLHVSAWRASPWGAVTNIVMGFELLRSWTPRDGYFRPPHGRLTLPTWLFLCFRRAKVWWWTLDSGDTYEVLPSAEDIAEQARRAGGGVVLMHDANKHDGRLGFLLETTEVLLKMARKEGLRVCTLEELDRRIATADVRDAVVMGS
jgi:peptidoglycan/xylan/chitin deacetylase (PgdA/CDA1 family)